MNIFYRRHYFASKAKNLHVLFLAVVLVLSSVLDAQKPNLKFDHLDISAGISQNHVLCTIQDKRGFMWFGTHDGLNKYDGYTFTSIPQ